MSVRMVKIEEIKIGDRFRTDLGDIDYLVWAIKTFGLIYRPIVTKDMILSDGFRRITALKKLGLEEMEVVVFEYPEAA